MVAIATTNRKSAVLNTSSLACLSRIPTINLTSGCAHGCVYCYTRGYTGYPGEDKVVIYQNTLEKLRDELASRRNKPHAVYFSPSSDLFQPLTEVTALAHQVLEALLDRDIGVAFVTKGNIPKRTLDLLLRHAQLVRAQIGVTTLDERIRRMFEPNTASTSSRLVQMAALRAGGIEAEARLDPVLPGLTDDMGSLRSLFSALARVGTKRASASALFLRPRVSASLQRNIRDDAILQTLLEPYRHGVRLPIHAEGSFVVALPLQVREDIYTRVSTAAEEHGIKVLACACKNPDLSLGTCNISGSWPRANQRSLFDEGG